MTPQVRFHIALCMENVGMLTQALEGFQLAAREALLERTYQSLKKSDS